MYRVAIFETKVAEYTLDVSLLVYFNGTRFSVASDSASEVESGTTVVCDFE